VVGTYNPTSSKRVKELVDNKLDSDVDNWHYLSRKELKVEICFTNQAGIEIKIAGFLRAKIIWKYWVRFQTYRQNSYDQIFDGSFVAWLASPWKVIVTLT